LTEVLTALGWRVNQYLPHRLDEGYGLSQDGVENVSENFPSGLLLAVDCGSTAVSTIAWLRQRGVDVLVLDHHQPSDPPPSATALVNPQMGSRPGVSSLQPDRPEACPPFHELCSAGLAFKLAYALVKHGRQAGLRRLTTLTFARCWTWSRWERSRIWFVDR